MSLLRRTPPASDTTSRTSATGNQQTEAQKIRAAVDSESRPYTDPAADYPAARRYRATRH